MDILKIGLVALTCSVEVLASSTVYNAARYKLIIDRAPFGVDPLQGQSVNSAAQAQQDAAVAASVAKELRLCFLMENEEGEIRAGFENLKAPPGSPRSVILREGEAFQGMKLLKIDLQGSKATLERDGVPILFELAKAPVPAKSVQAKKPTPQPQRRFGGGFRKRTPPVQPVPRRSPEEERRHREEVKARLQQYQMEIIRAGQPPLPIPLTKEMDDELVAEGILPPQ